MSEPPNIAVDNALRPISFYHFAHHPAKINIQNARFQHLASANFTGHYPLIAIDAEVLKRPRKMDIAIAVATVDNEPHAGDDHAIITDEQLHTTPDANVNIEVVGDVNTNHSNAQNLAIDGANTAQASSISSSDDLLNDPKVLAHADTLIESDAIPEQTAEKLIEHIEDDGDTHQHPDEVLEDVYTSEEEQKAERESKLEAYKTFVAEQESKVDIDYAGIRVNIEANALPSKMYFIMNALSAIIASYGLVVNSPAVVIGAMLVAMMLGPISGVALAIIDYRIPFLRRSLLTVIAGGVMVMSIGFIVGYMHNDLALSNEILSRTQPTSMDLMIALAGGLAGAYAMISPHLSVAVVGVAVATALVPPLAASGILFAHGEGSLGFGALLLAITNIIAIQFTNALVLWFSGFRRLMEEDYKTNAHFAFLRRNAVPLLLLAGIATYLTINLNTISTKQKYETDVKETISTYFEDKGNVLTATQFVNREEHQSIRAVIRGETRPSSTDAKNIEALITKRIDEKYPDYLPVHLQLRYLPVVVIDSSPDQSEQINATDAAILAVNE